MAGRRRRRGDRYTSLNCRSVPLPLFALYGLAAGSVTWLVAAWRDRRAARRLRDKARYGRNDGERDP